MKGCIYFIVLSMLLIACANRKSRHGKREITLSDVSSIEIGDELNDSTPVILTPNDARIFVQKWNDAASVGLCKYYPEFWITVHLKDKIDRSFRQNGKTIKESSDECFEIGDPREYLGLYR